MTNAEQPEREAKPIDWYNPNNVARRNLIRGLSEIYANLGAQFDALHKSGQPVPEEIEIKTKISLK